MLCLLFSLCDLLLAFCFCCFVCAVCRWCELFTLCLLVVIVFLYFCFGVDLCLLILVFGVLVSVAWDYYLFGLLIDCGFF